MDLDAADADAAAAEELQKIDEAESFKLQPLQKRSRAIDGLTSGDNDAEHAHARVSPPPYDNPVQETREKDGAMSAPAAAPGAAKADEASSSAERQRGSRFLCFATDSNGRSSRRADDASAPGDASAPSSATPMPRRRGSVSALIVTSALQSSGQVGMSFENVEDVDDGEPSLQCTLHPQSAFRFYWDCVILLLMALTSIILPLDIASFDFMQVRGWLYVEQAINAFFVIDLVLNFHTGYVDADDRVLVMDSRATRIHYFKHCARRTAHTHARPRALAPMHSSPSLRRRRYGGGTASLACVAPRPPPRRTACSWLLALGLLPGLCPRHRLSVSASSRYLAQGSASI